MSVVTTVGAIPEAIRREMRGRSWRDDPRCPPFEALRLVRPRYLDFEGVIREGEIVVAASAADAVVAAFEALHELRFPIRSVARIDHFAADDEASMEADNSSGFNFRTIPGSAQLSHHALGLAIDVNPRENPMILDGVVFPPSALPFVDRGRAHPGMFTPGSAALDVFRGGGWEWGGDWPDLRDYHHFSRLPRRAPTAP